jgi:hypothetical protein
MSDTISRGRLLDSIQHLFDVRCMCPVGLEFEIFFQRFPGMAAMNVGEWLRSLGLEQYEAVFRENAIDADVLHDLTHDHLRELGLPLGARLRLLKAISALDPRRRLHRQVGRLSHP